MKAKCAHCGDEMKQDTNGNMAFYCNKEECADVFYEYRNEKLN